MIQKDRDAIAIKWGVVSAVFGVDLSKAALTMLVNAVSDLNPDAVLRALDEWVKTAKQRRAPMPAEIRELCTPQISPDAQAREAAARIPDAIKRHGYNWPDRAREYIGELGWSVVQRFGGWEHVCQYHGTPEMNAQTFYAQARDLARSHIELAATGTLGQAPALPMPRNNQPGLQRMGDYMGLVPRPEGSK